MASFPNTSRRTFRGRSGPTDSQLNKHQARRRKQHPQETRPEKNNKYGDFDEINVDKFTITSEPPDTLVDIPDEHEVIIVTEESDKADDVEQSRVLESNTTTESTTESASPTGNPAAAKEIKHLLKRLRNVSESISLSAAAISNPMTWRSNVLNAVQNGVNEWRAIHLHYSNDGLEDAQVKEPAVAAYLLIQQAMQSGPLTGSNPGYFKRCGSAVAKQALIFLEETVPAGTAQEELRFSEKQALAIEKFKKAAQKAVDNDKPPSKSQIKKHAGKGKKK